MLLTNLTKVIRFFFKAKQNSSALRFSAIKPDQNVSPPCCYWLLKEKPWHHYENCKLPACFPPSPPPASHTHTSSLTSALSFQILSISSLRCFCRCCPAATPLLLSDPLRHPNPQAPSLSTIFLPPPAFISTSHLASESHGSWIIHMCSSPGNFPAFWPFQKPLYVHHRWPACWYKTPTKERVWVCDLFVSLSKCIITACCGCENTNLPICTEIQQNGGERKRRHALLAQGYIATIPTHFPSSRGIVEEIMLNLEPLSLWRPISTSAINLST